MEFTIGDKEFRAGKLDAFKQLHVSRRLAPIIPTLVPVFLKVAGDGVRDIAKLAEMAQPFADALASMSDQDTEYVLSCCLSVVRRKSGNEWAPVWSNQARAPMFDDLDLGDLIQIAIKVIADSLGNFIRGLLMSQMGGSTEES